MRQAHRLVQSAALTVYLLALILTFALAFLHLSGSWVWICLVLGGIPLAWYLSDALTGMLHWFFDTYGDESTPVLGPTVIGPFRTHHRDAVEMSRHPLGHTLGNSALLGAPAQVGAAALVLNGDIPAVSAFALWFSVFAAGAVFANLFHRWAHEERPPSVARFLQKLGLIIDPERHDRHHHGAFATNYCITWGRADALLDRLGVFRGLERGLALFGMRISADATRERTRHALEGAPDTGAVAPKGRGAPGVLSGIIAFFPDRRAAARLVPQKPAGWSFALERFLLYALILLAGEIAFYSIIKWGRQTPILEYLFLFQWSVDPALNLNAIWNVDPALLFGQASLYMLFVYGGATFLWCEPVFDRLHHWPVWARALLYAPGILAFEWAAGWVLWFLTGHSIWLYAGPWQIGRYTSLAIAPIWGLLPIVLFEPLYLAVLKREIALRNFYAAGGEV